MKSLEMGSIIFGIHPAGWMNDQIGASVGVMATFVVDPPGPIENNWHKFQGPRPWLRSFTLTGEGKAEE